MEKTKLSDLRPNPQNPRKISNQKLEMLKNSLYEFGSLDGFLYNIRTERMFGGHQRQKTSDGESKIVITEKYSTPTSKGTVAIGYVEIDGERHPYREVDWEEPKEMAANLAANKGAGEWDMGLVTNIILDLDSLNLNLDLTMFDMDERENFVVGSDTSKETKKFECPQCGWKKA
jgi:hypothetical protein